MRAVDGSRATERPPAERSKLAVLVGSGDRIGLVVLPFLIVAVVLDLAFPAFFAVGGPPPALRALSIVMLVPGLVVWAWSVILILRKVPRSQLITTGPYAVVKHPLYTGVAFLVVPWVGFLLDTWLGVVVGVVLYAASRRFSPAEEEDLAATFGPAWDDYCRSVWFPQV